MADRRWDAGLEKSATTIWIPPNYFLLQVSTKALDTSGYVVVWLSSHRGLHGGETLSPGWQACGSSQVAQCVQILLAHRKQMKEDSELFSFIVIPLPGHPNYYRCGSVRQKLPLPNSVSPPTSPTFRWEITTFHWPPTGIFILPFKDLLTRCLTEDPLSRITAEEALAHPLFHLQPPPLPQPNDMALLPSPVLRVTFMSKEEEGKSEEEMLASLRSECAEYGEITECCLAEGGGAFVHFQEVRAAKRALVGLTVCTNNPPVEDEEEADWLPDSTKHPSTSWRVGFYPLDLWRQQLRLIAH